MIEDQVQQDAISSAKHGPDFMHASLHVALRANL